MPRRPAPPTTPGRRGKPRMSGPTPSDTRAAEEKLLDTEQEIAEYEFRIAGANGFTGAKDLNVDDVVSVNLGGKVTGVALVTRRRHESGAGSEEEYLVRVVTIKATGARLT